MLFYLRRIINYGFRTHEQQVFIRSLPRMALDNDESAIASVRSLYENRQKIENCQQVSEFVERFQNFLLLRKKCTVAHLQCYYKMKEMMLVTSPFRHNVHRKYYHYLLDQNNQIRNENVEKYLWFLFDQGKFQRDLFQEAASNYTIKLHQIYEYMHGLSKLPTWQPFIRVATMLKYLGHEVKGHKGLGDRANLARIEYRYYPYIATFFNQEQQRNIRKQYKYDEPYITMLINEYFIKNTSRYDSYLQRVQRVQIQKSYERVLETMNWSDIVPLLELVYLNYTMNGSNNDIENQVSEIFFRLCQHANIDLQTIIGILEVMYKDKNFMFFRRKPILSRVIDSIETKGMEDFDYLPTQAYIRLLEVSTSMDLPQEAIKSLQKFLCKKVINKRIWNDDDIQLLRRAVEGGRFEGGHQLLTSLQELQKQR